MGYYFSVRGWVEIDPDHIAQVKHKIREICAQKTHDEFLQIYSKGWCFPQQVINWTAYIFYGADVKKDGVDFLIETLDELIKQGYSISGYFHIQSEDNTLNYEIKLNDDALVLVDALPIIENR